MALYLASSIMNWMKISEYILFLGLAFYFASKVTTSFIRFQSGIVGVGTKEVYQRNVRFPSISICLETKRNETVRGFTQVKPLNETFIELKYVQHFENG